MIEIQRESVYYKLGDEEFKYLIQNNKLNIIAKNDQNFNIIYVKFILTLKLKLKNKEIAQEINENVNHIIKLILVTYINLNLIFKEA